MEFSNMLAELQHLSNSLSEFGVSTPEVHKWVKPIARGSFVIANLDESGSVREAELREMADDSQISKVQKDNQNGFPIFKLSYPLFKVPADHFLREKLKSKTLTNAERGHIFQTICESAELSDGFEKSKKRLLQLRKFSVEELKPRFDPSLPENPALAKLFGAIAAESFSAEQVLRTIAEAIPVAVERGESASVAERALIGPVKKSGEVETGDLPVVLDVWRSPRDSFLR